MKKLLFLSFFVFLLIQSSCVKEPIVDDTPIGVVMNSSGTGANFQTLPNPYALDVMQDIYDKYSPGTILAPTDLYVKFMPKDSSELRRLTHDYNLEIFDHPLDIQINAGTIYVNNNIPETDLTWVYTTVAPNFVFPTGIAYEILEECYIPADGEVIGGPSKEVINVEEEAFLSLGYDYDTSGSKARPSGTIKVRDNSSNPTRLVPVKGVKIRCYKFMKYESAYTNDSGYYFIDKNFNTTVNYTIIFTNVKDFDMWGNLGVFSRAKYQMGEYSNSGHSENIENNHGAWKWAVINNGAYDYYKMCEETGILKPPTDLKIWEAFGSAAPMFRRVNHVFGFNTNDCFNFLTALGVNIAITDLILFFRFLLPDIFITTDYNSYKNIYKTVNHELAHASHFSKVGSHFWADYISYIITYVGYGDGTGNNAELCGIGEMWGHAMEFISSHIYYENSIEVGNYPEPSYYWFKPEVFWDLMAGNILTPKQIFDCLNIGVDTYDELYDTMCATYPNKVNNITQIFRAYGLISGEDVTAPNQPPAN